MELREELIFKSSKGPKLELEIPEEDGADDKLTLGLKGLFNKALAQALGVEWLFASDTVANPGIKDANLKGDISFTDVELKLVGEGGSLDTFYPEKVHSFRVFSVGGGGLGIQCKIDMDGHLDDVLDFFRNHRSSGFEFRIKSRQGELFDGGVRVEMSKAASATDGDSSETTPPESDTTDRSYETRPRGGRRKKVQTITEPVADDQPDPEVDDLPFIN